MKQLWAAILSFLGIGKKKPPVIVVPPPPIEPPKPKLNWPDRRPVGMVMVANHKGITGTKNYMNDDQPFDSWIINHANSCVKYMTEINAQGCILWDGEGQEFPHPYSYIGDPRLTPSEIDPFFEIIKSAGFKVGVCIRPDQINWKDGWPYHIVPNNYFDELIAKIDYAKKRWGCTLFYVDTNVGDGMPPGTDNTGGYGQTLPTFIYSELTKRCPECLFIPEQFKPDYLDYTAPFNKHNSHHVQPNGFQILDVADTIWNMWQIVESVQAGNILMGRVWWPAPELQLIKDVYGKI